MKQSKIYQLALVITSILVLFTGCSGNNNKKDNIPDKREVPMYSECLALQLKGNSIDLCKLENDEIHKIDTIRLILDLEYNISNSVYVFLMNMENGINLKNNKIKIVSNNGEKIIDDFYSAKDLKLSSDGSKLAYRSFSKDSIESAEGLKIYDTVNNKEITKDKNVLVSGDLYNWVNKDEILYYGIDLSENSVSKIFKYDTRDMKQSEYLSEIDGYCKYFTIIDDNLLYLTYDGNNHKMYFYDSESNKSRFITDNVENIYESVIDNERKKIYFIASEEGIDLCSLYSFSMDNFEVEKLTYEFPKEVDKNGGMALDKNGKVYFCGYTSESNKSNNEVFMYNTEDMSANLISIEEGKYHIVNSSK